MVDNDSVYVVDDDPAILQSIEALLSESGYRVACFDSAPQFLAKAPLDDPGCVICDLQMPVFDGIELIRRLNVRKSLLAVVVVTGVADVAKAVELMESGAVTVLEKPFEQATLLLSIRRAVAKSHDRWKKQEDERTVRQPIDVD